MNGVATSFTSSGWHHDYHDNLYCVWEGVKRFELAAPSSGFTTKGTLHTLHANGRFVYKEQLPSNISSKPTNMIRPDGALECVDRIYELEQERNALLEKEEENELVEERLQQIEEELLDYECDGSDDEDDDDDDDDDDGDDGCNIDDHDNNDNERTDGLPVTKRAKLNADATPISEENADLPLNFVTHMPLDDGNENRSAAIQTVTLHRGDLLYLPAGWFHTVQSSGCIHVAFNYWMHPPDMDAPFARSYHSVFLKRPFKAIAKLRNIFSNVVFFFVVPFRFVNCG